MNKQSYNFNTNSSFQGFLNPDITILHSLTCLYSRKVNIIYIVVWLDLT